MTEATRIQGWERHAGKAMDEVGKGPRSAAPRDRRVFGRRCIGWSVEPPQVRARLCWCTRGADPLHIPACKENHESRKQKFMSLTVD